MDVSMTRSDRMERDLKWRVRKRRQTLLIRCWLGHFPGCPVVKTLCFQCKGREFDPWVGN